MGTGYTTRRLDESACAQAGTKLRSNAEALRKEGEILTEKLEQALAKHGEVTQVIADSIRGVTMPVIDRGTDTSVSGFQNLLEGIEATFISTSFLQTSPEAQARQQRASRLLELCFPRGTGYLNLPHGEQWVELNKLKTALSTDEAKALVSKLGLALEVEHLMKWIELYGARAGITQSLESPSRRAKALLDDWHKSYDRVAVQAQAAYDDEDDPEHRRKLALFLGPYEEQLEKLRQEAREAARRREEEEEKAEQAKKKPV